MNFAIRLRLFVSAIFVCASGTVAEASTYLPITDKSLVDRSPIAIVGRVQGSEPFGDTKTAYRVSVERVLKGSLSTHDISVAVPGGENYIVPGMPRFSAGQRVILFLAPHSDGAFRIVELMLGAFKERVVQDSFASRAERDLAESFSLGESQPEPARDFESFATWIENLAARGVVAQNYLRPLAEPAAPLVAPEATPFTFLGSPARWTQFDTGRRVDWVLRPGASTLAGGGATAFQAALTAFNTQPDTIFNFAYIGTNASAPSFFAIDGVNSVLMNDPFDDIEGSFDCSRGGVIAYGGFLASGTHTYKGSSHRTAIEGDIVTQNGSDCAFATFAETFAVQVFGHEVGHVIGLGHSCGDSGSGECSPGSVQNDSLMRARAHNDNRGARFSSDDIDGLKRLYERVVVGDGTAGLAVPAVTAPASGQAVVVTGVGFTWTSVSGASGYDIRVSAAATGAVLFSGSLSGGASTSTLISLPLGSYRFAVRACAGGFAASQCGGYGTVSFTVTPAFPASAPTVTFPVSAANLTSSTQTLSWTAVTPNPALSGLTYEVLLRNVTAGTTALQITVPSPTLSTIFTMRSSARYELKVRACQAGCGPYSPAVTFAVTLPAVPTVAPAITSCLVTGNNLTCSWAPVVNADAYQVQLVQAPPAGPGGGALTGAARQVSATTVTLPVPAGAATVFIGACNGDGCGPNATTAITVAGANPSQANIGTPMAGTVVTGPGVLFTWNRVPGDTGTNTGYRLFVQDLSRQSTALDVFTTSNFHSAFFKAEGARYDALVVSNPGLTSAVTGPSQGFNVSGSSATAPTMVSPAHNSTLASGNIQLGWSPVPGATLYEYFVAVLGQGSASASGVTPGLLTQVPLTGTGTGTVYSGIVRACPAGATCASGSNAGWGPWSNAPGGPGVTNFTVTP